VTVSGLVELTLQVRDLPALESFYADVFGLRMLKREDDRVWLAAGPSAFAFSAEPGSLDGLAARLRERGVPLREPEEHPGGDRSLYVEDPEGNVVEVWDFFERGEGAAHGTDALAKEPD
jgi:catechol-2,3-dioxygenase